MREFKGRVVTPGNVTAEAVVTHGGFNTLASLQGALQFGDKTATCKDQNNPDLFGKGVSTSGTNLGQWPDKAVILSKGNKKLRAYANYYGNDQKDVTLAITDGPWTDVLTGKTVNNGSYVLKSGQALVLVNSSVVK